MAYNVLSGTLSLYTTTTIADPLLLLGCCRWYRRNQSHAR